MKLLTPVFVLLLTGVVSPSIGKYGHASATQPAGAAGTGGLSPSATAAQNTAALARAFANSGPTTIHIGRGIFSLRCGSSFNAAGAISIVGEGQAQSVLRLDQSCVADHPLMQWVSKSAVHLSGFTIDLAHSHFSSVQSVLSFLAYEGNASGLNVDNIAIINGNSPAFEIGVAASRGFTYSDVTINHNRLEMAPARSQNQCIALTTVNNSGRIPRAKITNNVCRGSGIQSDGQGTLIADNDVSGYEFGQGIFIAYVTKSNIDGARWQNGLVSLHLVQAGAKFVRGETVYIWGATPSTYNGTFTISQVDKNGISVPFSADPGTYVRGGFISPQPSSRDCIIRGNFIHDTPQSIDANRTAPGALENNCINSVVMNNRAEHLGGAGFFNFADGAKYIHNTATGVGYYGSGSAGGDGDGASFVVFDNGSGIKGYQSNGVTFSGNQSVTLGRQSRFGYFEEPYHHFSSTFQGNSFNGTERPMVTRNAP